MEKRQILLKSICPKVNVITQQEFELTFYDSAVRRFNHYTTRTTPETAEIYEELMKMDEVFTPK